ncbi:MAG: hypothetical protein LBU06_01955 [Desulfovibrio sp.]|jgi:hypothetical protein|nr:hypothetical protein [Desulfovibrio sp.]
MGRIDLIKSYYYTKILSNALVIKNINEKMISFSANVEEESYVKEILKLIKPMMAVTSLSPGKIRIGENRDGGYVMLNPGFQGGVAYSFGVSSHSPWDDEMAARGFHVFQYDGTMQPPQAKPNLHFHPYNITGDRDPQPDCKNIENIISDLGHEKENNIILQIDIENAEWDFFAAISEKTLSKFSQIIVEFHRLTDFGHNIRQKHLDVLKKICITHQSIHYHINNYGNVAVFSSCNIGYAIEVTYVRRQGNNFMPDYGEYPVYALDYPDNPMLPDIYIGNLEILLSGADTLSDLSLEE